MRDNVKGNKGLRNIHTCSGKSKGMLRQLLEDQVLQANGNNGEVEHCCRRGTHR